jgi:hypothetical protein
MPIQINNFNIADIYINGYYIKEIYNGNILVYEKNKGVPIDVSDYEYTLDSKGNLVLTKYIGASPEKVNPNI